jgi:hypothetical protein
LNSNSAFSFLTFSTNKAGLVNAVFGANPSAVHLQTDNIRMAAAYSGNTDVLGVDGNIRISPSVSNNVLLKVHGLVIESDPYRKALVADIGQFLASNEYRIASTSNNGGDTGITNEWLRFNINGDRSVRITNAVFVGTQPSFSVLATNTAPYSTVTTNIPAFNEVRTNTSGGRLLIHAAFLWVNAIDVFGSDGVWDIYTALNNVTNHFGPLQVSDINSMSAPSRVRMSLTADISPGATYWPTNILSQECTITVENWWERVQ